MALVANPVAAIKPLAVYAFPDTVVIRLKTPLSKRAFDQLKSQCRPNGCFSRKAVKPWDKGWPWRLILHQPSQRALRMLARHAHRVTAWHEALDLIFGNSEDKDAAQAVFNQHLVQRHHRAKHGVRIVGKYPWKQTRYNGPRQAASNLVLYGHRECRITGEVDCLHLELRMLRARTIKRRGVTSTQDIKRLDRRALWQKHLLLCDLDVERLARMLTNAQLGSRQRNASTVSKRQERFIRLLLKRFPVQTILDRYRSVTCRGRERRINIAKALIRNPVEHLLPEAERGESTRQHMQVLPIDNLLTEQCVMSAPVQWPHVSYVKGSESRGRTQR
jgi:hypothetical protein